MSKKNLFGFIIICGLLIAACAPITPDEARSMSQRQNVQEMIDRVNTSTYCVDPPYTKLDLKFAADAHDGDYFWTFFLNFKERVLEPESISDWPARLRLSACFKLFARHTDIDVNINKFVWIGETLVPCYLLGPNDEEHWITTNNLPQIESKFNDHEVWKNDSVTSIVTAIKLTETDRIRCDFDFKALINKAQQDARLSGNIESLNPLDKTNLEGAINEIGTDESSEWFPYLHIFVGGIIEHTIGDGVLIDFTPKTNGDHNPTDYHKPISFTTQVNDSPNLSVNLNGNMYTSTCFRQEYKPVALRADFEPKSEISGLALHDADYKMPYRVQFQYDSEDSDTIVCDEIVAHDTEPVHFWPYESTVTIGGNIEGELYAVWLDPDDASKK